METVRLSEENLPDYAEFIPEDIAEHISRIHYRGLIVAEDGRLLAGLIWTLKNIRENTDAGVESQIVWFDVAEDSEEAVTMLFSGYDEMIAYDDVVRSSFILPARTSKTEKSILKEQGFTAKLMEGDEITASLSEISEIGFLKKISLPDTVRPLRTITQRGFNIAIRRMVARGYYGLCEDIDELPRLYFENDVSCYWEEDDEIKGLFLCHLTPSGKLLVELMVAIGQNYTKMLPPLIAGAFFSASEAYPPETEVVIDRHNYAALALGEKLFPRGFGIPVYIGNREENGR
jgi:hypothetical protein